MIKYNKRKMINIKKTLLNHITIQLAKPKWPISKIFFSREQSCIPKH